MTLWTLAITLELLRNLFLIVGRKRKPNYAQSFVIRFFGGLSVLIIEYPQFDPLGSPITILLALPFVVFQITSFYLLFDPVLNLIRGKAWNYRGKDSGYLDRSPLWAYWSLKILCLTGLILSLIALI